MGKHSKPEESQTQESTGPYAESRTTATDLSTAPASEIRAATNPWGELDG